VTDHDRLRKAGIHNSRVDDINHRRQARVGRRGTSMAGEVGGDRNGPGGQSGDYRVPHPVVERKAVKEYERWRLDGFHGMLLMFRNGVTVL
jgi:hypothetical protein